MRFYSLELAGKTVLDNRGFACVALLATMMIVPRYLQAGTPAVTGPCTPQITVVDLIPKSLSGETEDDAEPNMAVNPANPLQVAASAFTREPMRRADRAPIFVSTDGGMTWSLRSIVRSPQITCDVTLRFGSSSVLYVSALRNELQGYANRELVICQTADYATTRLMVEVFNQRMYIDQPYIAAMTVASKDHVFVDDGDFNYPTGQAAIHRSLDAAHGGFTPVLIEYRPKTIDWSEVRPAIGAGGKVVYAAFNRVTSLSDDQTPLSSDVVVVRDDGGGVSPLPFSSLEDPEGGYGLRVVKQRVFAWNTCLGGDRLGDDLAIAVHPINKNKVYLVWSDWVNDRVSLHLKYSTDSGQSWSCNKRDIPDAKNPGLAVTAKGTVGFLYQQVVETPEGNTWMTQLERTTDDFKTTPKPLTLATFPSNCPLYKSGCDDILLGDYLHLMSVDKNFYGIFSSNNLPVLLRFPCGVKFQRRTDFNAKKLLDLQGKKVCPSIDPFFFKVAE